MSTVTSPHILIINDARKVQVFVRDLLEAKGYQVGALEPGAPDLAAIGQLAPDVIVLDAKWLTTPEWALLRGLMTEPRTRAIPVVLCTICTNPVVTARELQSRLAGLTIRIVPKPYTLDDLLAEVVALLAVGRPIGSKILPELPLS